MPSISTRTLRHAAAHLAIAAGADVKVVQQMLGHGSATMTLATYGHLFEDRLDEVGYAMERPQRSARRLPRCPPYLLLPQRCQPGTQTAVVQDAKGIVQVSCRVRLAPPTGFEPVLPP